MVFCPTKRKALLFFLMDVVTPPPSLEMEMNHFYNQDFILLDPTVYIMSCGEYV
jgi:hypothetical protein